MGLCVWTINFLKDFLIGIQGVKQLNEMKKALFRPKYKHVNKWVNSNKDS